MDFTNFKFSKQLPFNKAIKKLIDALDLNNLQVTTNKSISELKAPPYKVDSVTMSGEPGYINNKLNELRRIILTRLRNYTDSYESINTKIHTLGLAEILITEKIIYWDLDFPELYEGPQSLDMIDKNNLVKVVRFDELDFSDKIIYEILKHHKVRIEFFQFLIKCIQFHIRKLTLSLETYSEINYDTHLKSIDLVEVWLGLIKMGCFNLKEKNEVVIRNEFFKLFGFKDIQFNDIHNHIKSRKFVKFSFIKKMNTALIKAYEK